MPNMVAASQSGGSGFSMLLLLLPFLLIALMFFSQRKRAQATQRAQAALSVGDEVCTTSGMYGTLRRLDDALAELGILAAPGDFYGVAGEQHVRIALTATDERIDAAVRRLTAG